MERNIPIVRLINNKSVCGGEWMDFIKSSLARQVRNIELLMDMRQTDE